MPMTNRLYRWLFTATTAVCLTLCASSARAQSTYGDLVSSMNPVSYWRLGDSGSTANDERGVRDGRYRNGVSLGETGTPAGDANDDAAGFDGSNDYVEFGHSNRYLLNNGSLAVWFRYDGGDGAVFSKDHTGYGTGGHFTLFSGNAPAVRLQSTSRSYNVYGNSLTPGEWVHIVFSWGSGGMKLYQNGQLVDTDGYRGGLGNNSGGSGNREPFTIGASTWVSLPGTVHPVVRHFRGVIDEVAIFGSALSDPDVRRLYEGVVSSQTYYVRTRGNDNNDGLSPQRAFRTVRKAAFVARAGATVWVGAGTYSDRIEVANDGTSDHPIRFLADQSGANTGDAGDVVFNSRNALTVHGDHHIHFIGFKFTRGDDVVQWRSSVGGLLKDCELYNSDDPIHVDDAELTIENCNIHDNDDDGIEVDGDSTLIVRDSTISKSRDEGVWIRDARQVVLENTVIADNRDQGIRIEARSSSDTVILRRCQIIGNSDGIRTYRDSQITIENCLVADNSGEGIHIDSGSPNMTINHCTIANNNRDGFEQDSGSCEIVNSIIAFNGDDGLDRDGGSLTHSYNVVYGNRDDDFDRTSRHQTEIVADPQFVGRGNYHLKRTSPAINQGTGSTSIDLDGTARPQGSGVDIGCYEDAGAVTGTYFVRIRGDDNNTGFSPSQAFRTIGKAASVVQRGDTVYVGAGTYRESVNLSKTGTADKPIRFIADVQGQKTGDAGAVIVSAPRPDAWSWSLNKADFAVLEGFRLSGSGTRNANGVNIANSKGVTLKNCEVDHNLFGVYADSSGLFVSGCQLHDNLNSLETSRGVLFLKDSRFRQNTAGPASKQDFAFRAQGSTFVENQDFALHLARPNSLVNIGLLGVDLVSGLSNLGSAHATLVDCVLDRNSNGPSLEGYSRFDDVDFDNTSNSNNQNWALILTNCQLDFSPATWREWPIGTAGSGILGEDCQLSFRDLTLEGFGGGYAVLAKGGQLSVQSCRFRNNDTGLGAEYCSRFTARSCEFRDNQSWGLAISGKGTLQSCTIQNNQSGLHLHDTNDAQLDVSNTTLQNNTEYGVYARACRLRLTSSDQNDWRISGNGYGLFGFESDLTLQSFDISGNSVYGLVSQQGTLQLEGGVLSNNGAGVFSDRNTSFTARNTQFTANASWGVVATGPADLADCRIHQNGTGGLHLVDSSNAILKLRGTRITDNGKYGIYATRCQLTLDPATTNNWHIGSHDYLVFADQSGLTVDGLTITGGKLFGVAAQFGTLTVRKATFTGNTSGLFSNQNTAFSAVDSDFSTNTQWGLTVNGKASLDRCTVANNASGILLQQSTDGDVDLRDTEVRDNTDYGIFADQCTLTFSPNRFPSLSVSGSKTSYAGQESRLTFDRYTVSGGSQYGLASFTGDLQVTDCTFSGNGIGLYAERNNSCSVERSTFRDNTSFGARVTGLASLSDCTIEQNANGLSLVGCRDGDVTLRNTRIRRNTDYGVHADTCALTFTAAMQRDWLVDANGSSFGGSGSDLTFESFTISGGTSYGLVSSNGNLVLRNATLTGNGTGVHSSQDLSFAATGTRFTQNQAWGASIEGPATLASCTFSNNADGLRLFGIADADVQASDVQIVDNSRYGLYLEQCTLTLDQALTTKLTIARNGYGVVGLQSSLVFDQYVVQDNTSYGAKTEACDVVVQNSSFAGNGVGFYSKNNNSFSAADTQFTGNSSLGLQVDGKATLTDCSLTNNANGLLLNGATATDVSLQGLTIADNSGYGCHLSNCNLSLDGSVLAGGRMSGNGYSVVSENSTLTLDGLALADSTDYGIYSSDSALEVRDTSVSSAGQGLYGLRNSALSVIRSRFDGGGSGWAIQCHRGDMTVHNTIVSGHTGGIYLYSADRSNTGSIYNTTVAGAQTYGILVDHAAAQVMNTIIAGASGQYGLAQENSGLVQHSNNLVHGFATPFHQTAQHESELLENPHFVDAVNGDFHLASGSPAINSGADLSLALNDDMERNPRPSFRAFEIGAYEYMSDAGSLRVLTWKEQQ